MSQQASPALICRTGHVVSGRSVEHDIEADQFGLCNRRTADGVREPADRIRPHQLVTIRRGRRRPLRDHLVEVALGDQQVALERPYRDVDVRHEGPCLFAWLAGADHPPPVGLLALIPFLGFAAMLVYWRAIACARWKANARIRSHAYIRFGQAPSSALIERGPDRHRTACIVSSAARSDGVARRWRVKGIEAWSDPKLSR